MDRTLTGAPVRWPLRAAPVRPRDRRNSFPIHGYTGFNSSGKTMAAVYDSLPALAAGRPVVSTCRILDPRTGEPHPLWVPLDDFRLLLDLEYCDVILDEVTGVASSRDSAGLPSSVLNRLMQLRKGDVSVRWTTPNWRLAGLTSVCERSLRGSPRRAASTRSLSPTNRRTAWSGAGSNDARSCG